MGDRVTRWRWWLAKKIAPYERIALGLTVEGTVVLDMTTPTIVENCVMLPVRFEVEEQPASGG